MGFSFLMYYLMLFFLELMSSTSKLKETFFRKSLHFYKFQDLFSPAFWFTFTFCDIFEILPDKNECRSQILSKIVIFIDDPSFYLLSYEIIRLHLTYFS